MPRASTSPKKARAAGPSALRSQSSSPRKSVRRTAVVEVVDEADDSDELSDDTDESEDPEAGVDESLWRSSKIPAERTIMKTDIKDRYRLSPAAIAHLAFTSHLSEEGRPMYLYKEREVERTAWIKHGGPEEFDIYLEKLHSRWIKRGRKGIFKSPRKYTIRQIRHASPEEAYSKERDMAITSLGLDESQYCGDPDWLLDNAGEFYPWA